MNIDQLLNLEENEKLSKLLNDNTNVQNFPQNYFNLYDKINQMNTSNQNLNNQFDLLSNYSNFQLNQNSTANLIKTANQLGLNSNFLENLLMKNSTNSFMNDKNDLMSLSMNLQQAVCEQKNLFNYNFSMNQLNDEQNRTNELTNNLKNSLDENNYGTYFNQLLNKKLNDNLQSNKDNQNLNEISFEKQQNLANAVAACYSNKNITAAAVAAAMDINNQNINFIKNSQEVDLEKSKMRCISDEKNKFFNNTNQLNLSNQNRPSSTNSLNYSISSNETDCDYSSEEMIKKTKDLENKVIDPNNISSNKLKDKNDEENSIDCKLEKEKSFFNMDLSRINGLNEAIYIEYQDWAQRTYGDSAKTKTVTKKKYERIVKILNGEEPNNVENSKFRFWVKSKGFRLGAVGEENSTINATKTDDSKDVLYVPCIKSMNGAGCSQIGNLRNKNNSFIYKKVAVVENFFQIIYSVHVEMEGKAGKHAGQKRTYRAVAEMYAFLPREAVTRFLMSCKDCQKRMHLQINNFQKHPPSPPTSKNKTSNEFKEFLKTNSALEMNNYNEMNSSKRNTKKASNTLKNDINVTNSNKKLCNNNDFNFDLPISTAYLKQIDNLAKAGSVLTTNQINSLMCNSLSNLLADNLNDNLNLSLKNISKEIIDDDDQNSSCVHSLEDGLDNELDDNKIYRKDINFNLKDKDFENLNKNDCLAHNSSLKKLNDSNDTNENLKRKLDNFFENQDVSNKKQKNLFLEQNFNLDIKENNLDENCSKIFDTLVLKNLKDNQIRDAFNVSSKKNLKDFKLNEIANQSKEKKNDQSIQNMSEIKEEDDEDEEDDENPKINDDNVDPDKLKAFNMFVRLFIDENLDRSVPISRQPKEKIQAILDSCKRQFPELQNRARKRIRTYLKSCRRTKKIQNLRKMGQSLDLEFKNVSNENGSPDDYLVLSKETLNQPVYHLNSAIAERMLANAFENEILNARRIKEGLSPLSVNVENETTIKTSSPIKIYNKNPYQTFNTSLINRLIDIKQDDSFDKNKLKLTNNSLENLKIANNEKNIANLLEKSTKNLFQNKLENLTNNSTIKELLSIEQLITTANQNSISSSLVLETTTKSTCEIEAKVKSNERLLTNLFEYNLNETELVAIKQLITGYRESAAFLLRSAQELELLLLQQQA